MATQSAPMVPSTMECCSQPSSHRLSLLQGGKGNGDDLVRSLRDNFLYEISYPPFLSLSSLLSLSPSLLYVPLFLLFSPPSVPPSLPLSSFDRDLLHSIARAISDEVRGKHNVANQMGKYNYPYGLICWAPVLNICRDRK